MVDSADSSSWWEKPGLIALQCVELNHSVSVRILIQLLGGSDVASTRQSCGFVKETAIQTGESPCAELAYV